MKAMYRLPLDSALFKASSFGNDFLLYAVSEIDSIPADRIARNLCNRREGIGADGMVYYHCMKAGEYEVWLFNSDGSQAEFSGNGFACLGALLPQDEIHLTSLGQTYRIRNGENGIWVEAAKVSRDPAIEAGLKKILPDGNWCGINTGNPHAVCFDKLENRQVESFALNRDCFPAGINFGLAERKGSLVHLKVFERGVGWTPSCSSGALACARAVFEQDGLTEMLIVQPGGAARVMKKGETWMIELQPKLIAQILWLECIQS